MQIDHISGQPATSHRDHRNLRASDRVSIFSTFGWVTHDRAHEAGRICFRVRAARRCRFGRPPLNRSLAPIHVRATKSRPPLANPPSRTHDGGEVGRKSEMSSRERELEALVAQLKRRVH
eukprot:COSAG05_NODE_3112_length_2316_cov_5.407758_1_plen_119_part_10